MIDTILALLDPGAFEVADVQPSPPPPAQLFEQFARESRTWQPAELPAALPCRGAATRLGGEPAMGNAVVDARMPSELSLPLELVPPEEAAREAALILQKGGCFIFSDDYVDKYPQSKVADMVRAFDDQRSGGRNNAHQQTGRAKGEEPPEDDEPADPATSTAGPTPAGSFASAAAATDEPAASTTKRVEARLMMHEAAEVDRPLFRRQDPAAVYGQSKYRKRNFYAIMDEEFPIEYFI